MTGEETTRPSGRSGRAYGIVGVLAAIGAVVTFGSAVLGGNEGPTVEVAPATLAVPTDFEPTESDSQAPPVSQPPTTLASPSSDDPTESSSTTSVPRSSPTTTSSESIPPTTVTSVPPVGVETDRIDLSTFPIRPIGLEENGELEVPDETEIGWYEYGASPGNAGVTVLAAHVSWNRQLGPFAQLGTMEPGDTVYVTVADGRVEPYIVTERTVYPKDELPSDRLWRNIGDEALALITCGGRFDDSINRYRDNIVVYAEPA